MKKLIISLFVLMLLVTLGLVKNIRVSEAGNKVTICHCTPDGCNTQDVAEEALNGHFDAQGNPLHKGDHLGACVVNTPTVTATPSATLTPTVELTATPTPDKPKDYCDTLEGVQGEDEDCPICPLGQHAAWLDQGAWDNYEVECVPDPTPTPEPTPVSHDGPVAAPQAPACEAPTWAPTVTYLGQNGHDFTYSWTTVKDGLHTYWVDFGPTKDKLPYSVLVNGEKFTMTMEGNTNWMRVAGYDQGCVGKFSEIIN